MSLPKNIVEIADLRDRVQVFTDRHDAGSRLAGLLASEYADKKAVLLAIPAGGVPVAYPIACRLGLKLDLAVVSKILLPWNTESGYGAVAFDGTTRLNENLLPYLGLTEQQIEQGIAQTRDKVRRRVNAFRKNTPMPDLVGGSAILVDDGLASGFTVRVAVEAVRKAGAFRVNVAVPTGHLNSALMLANEVDTLYCANLRGGRSFAVADAYQRWYDVSEQEVFALLGV